MSYAPTYRYAVGIYGANYASADPMEPAHWVMAESLNHAEKILYEAKDNWRSRSDETGAGGRLYDTPVYGDPGDGAYIYRVSRDHPDFSEVLDEPGDRARYAFGFVNFDYPAYIAMFGARGGLRIEKA